MNQGKEYLTDTELDNLIREIERNELILPPPDLQEQILERLEVQAKEKILEYKRYRLRVLTTVAAAVAAVFMLPGYEELQKTGENFGELVKKPEWITEIRYESKEEALSEHNKLHTLLGGVNIFADNDKWNLFK